MPTEAAVVDAPATAPAPAVAPVAVSEPSPSSVDAQKQADRDFFRNPESKLPTAPGPKPVDTPAPPTPEAAAKPAVPSWEPPQFFKREEKALYEPLTPEKLAELKPFIAPFERQMKESEKGVQKYIQSLGPLSEIAKDPASVGFTRMVFDNAPSAGGDGKLIGAIDKLGQAYIESQRTGKPFDPAGVFGAPQADPNGVRQGMGGDPQRTAYVQELAKMTPEERGMAISANPERLFDAFLSSSERMDALERSVGQKLEPVTQMSERAAFEKRVEAEMNSWIGALPEEITSLPEDQYLALMSEVGEAYTESRDALVAKGHTQISAMDMALQTVMHKRELAKLQQGTAGAVAQANASREAALKATRTDSPAGGAAPQPQSKTGTGMNETLAEIYRKRNAGF